MLIIIVFFFKQKTAYEMLRSLVGSEMCIRDRYIRWDLKYKVILKVQAVTSYHMLEYHFYDRFENEIDLS